MTGKELYRLLVKEGWIEISAKGSHRKLVKGSKKLIIPYHTTELAKGTEKSILKIAKEVKE